MRNKNVLITLFVPSFRGGGAERFIVILANTLVLRGFKVDLVVCKAVGPYKDQVDSRVRVVDLGQNRVVASFPSLVRYFKRARPQSVLSTMLHANTICTLALRCSGHRAKLVLREASEPIIGGPMYDQIVYLAARWLYPRSDAVVAVSLGTKEKLTRALNLPEKLPIHVIDNPILPEMLSMSQLAPVPSIPGDPDAALILAAGRLELIKDFKTLISAVASLSSKRLIKLVILGEGSQRAALEKQVADLELVDQVFLLGFVSNPFAWMRECDVFVLSSVQEGSPNTLIQAVSCGAEVVASRISGCTDSLLDGLQAGRLVQAGSVQGFSQAIEQALVDPLKPDVDLWHKRFDVETIVDAYENVLLK